MRVYRKIEVRLPDGRAVGHIEGGTFYRTFHASRHLVRKPCPALAICEQTYRKYRPFFTELEWYDAETQRTYRISATTFEQRAFRLSRGYGEQYAVGLRYWAVHDPNAPPQGQLALAL